MCNFDHTDPSIHKTPGVLLEKSHALDNVDFDLHEVGLAAPFRFGIHFDDSLTEPMSALNLEATKILHPQHVFEQCTEAPATTKSDWQQVDKLWRQQAELLEAKFSSNLQSGQLSGCIGGDHSSSFGAMKAFGAHCKEQGESFGILQIDAHLDLYDVYDGLQCSHACVMKRVLDEVDNLDSFVAVGIRECGEEEVQRSFEDPRHHIFSAADLRRATLSAQSWSTYAQKIVEKLPQNVWVTLDIDGLDIEYCPGTGTPVPGGLSYFQAVDLLLEIVRSGRVLCGWDLVEVGSNAAAVNVGARLAYKLAGLQMVGVGAQDSIPLQTRGV